MGNIRGGALPGLHMQPTAQVINGSLKFDRTESHYLSRTFSAGNRKTFTFSFWVKASDYSEGGSVGTGGGRIFGAGTVGAGARSQLGFEGASNPSADRDKFSFGMNPTSGWKSVKTVATFRDFSAWQNFVVAVDCTQSTSSDRVKIYHNGVEQALTGTYPDDVDQPINSAVGHAIGRYNAEGTDYFNGLLSNFYFIDGQQLDSSDFGFTDPLTNTWRPKKYSGTFGTNGFWLSLDSEDNFEKDKSGNGNDWTKNNFSGTSVDPDVIKDSPSGVAFGGAPTSGVTTTSSAPSNYATLNPLLKGSSATLSNGNLDVTASGGNNGVSSTIGMSSGKWYCEVTVRNVGDETKLGIGKADAGSLTGQPGAAADTWAYIQTGQKMNSNSASSYGSSFTTGDTISVLFDADDGNLYFYKNGAEQNSGTAAYTGLTSGPYYFHFLARAISTANDLSVNFGQKPFKYAPPQGYLPLNSASVRSETVITRPDQYVGITTWTGNSTDDRQINTGFRPDLVWTKRRDSALDHIIFDSVRGKGNELYSNQNYEEGTGSTKIGGFNDFGFTVNDNSAINQTGDWVSWNWKAGGNKNTFNVDGLGYASAAAAGLNAGTLTISGASVGTKQGFSIIKYAGSASDSTFPHGLTQAPDFYMIKCLDVSAESWRVYHSSLGADYALTLNTSADASDSNIYFNDTEPTSTVASVYAGYDGVNNSGRNYVAYLWHDVPGLQKFGKYVGSDSADAKFVELGFRPALLVIKFYDGTDIGSHGGWKVIDNQRNKFNPQGISQKLAWDVDEDENGGTTISTSEGKVDFLSNGFRIRDGHSPFNTSGRNYIYAAWAEQPASNLYGGQSNAR